MKDDLMSRGVIENLAEGISLLMNAPIFAFITFLLLLLSTRTLNFPAILTTVLLFGTIGPLILVYLLSRRGIIPDYYASERETRTVPFLGAALSYLLGALILSSLTAPLIITALMLCYGVNTFIMMIINLKWKISIHASGITGPATFLFYSFGLIAIPFFLLVLPVGWARLRLRAHTPAQVLAGALLTIAITWLQLMTYLGLRIA